MDLHEQSSCVELLLDICIDTDDLGWAFQCRQHWQDLFTLHAGWTPGCLLPCSTLLHLLPCPSVPPPNAPPPRPL